jgi:hypothetical protein
MSVDEVLYATGEQPTTISFPQGFWDRGGSGVMVEGVDWTQPGDQVLLFLQGVDQAAVVDFTLATLQGQLEVAELPGGDASTSTTSIVAEAGSTSESDPTAELPADLLSTRLRGMPLDQLVAALAASGAKVRAGQVPVPPR